MVERVHEEINCRTRVAGLFPNEASLLCLVNTTLMVSTPKELFVYKDHI